MSNEFNNLEGEGRDALAGLQDVSQDPSPLTENGLPLGVETALDLVRFCRKCNAFVRFVGRGKCPQCQKFLPRNSAAQKTPSNVQAVIEREVEQEYEPTTPLGFRDCRHVARVYAQLETAMPGTQTFRNLMASKNEGKQTLEAARASKVEPRPAPLDSKTREELVAELEVLLARLKEPPFDPNFNLPDATPEATAAQPEVPVVEEV